jgi:hypothetical protein
MIVPDLGTQDNPLRLLLTYFENVFEMTVLSRFAEKAI